MMLFPRTPFCETFGVFVVLMVSWCRAEAWPVTEGITLHLMKGNSGRAAVLSRMYLCCSSEVDLHVICLACFNQGKLQRHSNHHCQKKKNNEMHKRCIFLVVYCPLCVPLLVETVCEMPKKGLPEQVGKRFLNQAVNVIHPAALSDSPPS